MRARIDSKRPFHAAVKVKVNRAKLEHFKGSVYILGKIARKEVVQFLPVLDEVVAKMRRERRQNVCDYYALVLASEKKPALALMDPERIHDLADLYGETIPEAIVRCKFGPY